MSGHQAMGAPPFRQSPCRIPIAEAHAEAGLPLALERRREKQFFSPHSKEPTHQSVKNSSS